MNESRRRRDPDDYPDWIKLQHGLREDEDGWYCCCSVRLWPDCDISAASVGDEFQDHIDAILVGAHLGSPSAWVSEPLSTVPFDETGARERAAEHAFSKGDLDT